MLENQPHHILPESRGRSHGKTRAWTRTFRNESKASSRALFPTPSNPQPVFSKLTESFPPKPTIPEAPPTQCLESRAGPVPQNTGPIDTIISISTSLQVVMPQLSSMAEVSTSHHPRSRHSTQMTAFNATMPGPSTLQTSSMIAESSQNSSISTTPSSTRSATVPTSESSQSATPPTSTKPPTTSAGASSNLLKKMPIDAKVGAIIGLVMLLLIVGVLSILFCTRKRRRRRLEAAKIPIVDPQSIFDPPVFRNGDAINKSAPSLDSAGIKWPEKVTLSGEAKEVCELKREFDCEFKNRRPLSCRKKREEECQMVVGRIEVGHLRREKVGRL